MIIIFTLQEYDIDWEYVMGKKITVTDVPSRINTKLNEILMKEEFIYRFYNIMINKKGSQKMFEVNFIQQSC